MTENRFYEAATPKNAGRQRLPTGAAKRLARGVTDPVTGPEAVVWVAGTPSALP